jgi:hypothetical protein
MKRFAFALLVFSALAGGALLALHRPGVEAASPGTTITVNSNADTNTRDAVMTLREAIMVATGALPLGDLQLGECNQVAGAEWFPLNGPCISIFLPPGAAYADTIAFDTVLFDPAELTFINLTSAPPSLDTGSDTIDGSSSGEVVWGVSALFDCVTIHSDNNTVKGLAIGRCLHGVRIDSGQGNTVGGSNPGEGNWMYNNNAAGVLIHGTAGGNSVKGNLIGTGPDGTGLGTNHWGVALGSGGNTIGGSSVAERNVISGNEVGVFLEGPGNTVKGNYIGTDAAGTAAIPNGTGVLMLNGAQNNTVGGSSAAERNVISGNSDAGVEISDSSNGNSVKGNYIGTDAAGTAAIPNGAGVLIMTGAQNNTIGGSSAGQRNVISGNTSYGLLIQGTGTTANRVEGNYIGTNAAGTAEIANATGVGITANALESTIGGTAAGEGNLIAFNTGNGVDIVGPSTTTNTIRGNSIHSNGGKGIDNANGGNTELAPPLITGFGSVMGTACPNCTIDVYSDDQDEGRVYEGSTTSDGAGDWTFDGSPQGPNVTATATDGVGNTSEFSAPVELMDATPTPTPTPTATPGGTVTPPAGPTRTLEWGPGWNNAAWSGPDGTAPEDVFACAAGKYAAAYRFVNGGLERFFPARPDISNMGPLNKYNAFLILITAPVTCVMPVSSTSGATAALQWGLGWNNSGWSGADGTAPGDAFACADGGYAAAYRYVASGLERFFPGRPDISNMAPLNKYAAFLILLSMPVTCTPPVGP